MGQATPKSWGPWVRDYLYEHGVANPNRGHPLAHISGSICYQWMREECAALQLARQQREDNIISSITSMSSAGLVAIPTILFTTSNEVPQGWRYIPTILGIILLSLSLSLALWEQIISANAYSEQEEISRNYYLKISPIRDNEKRYKLIKKIRTSCIFTFGIALGLCAIGLTQLRKHNDGKAPISATATATAITSSPPTGPVRRPGCAEVSSGGGAPASSKTLNGNPGLGGRQ